MKINLLVATPMFITLVWAIILLTTSKLNKAKLLLGIFMFASFLLFLTHVIYYDGYRKIYLPFDLIFIFGSLSVYPLYYWYVRLLTEEPNLRLKDVKVLIPAFAMLVVTASVYAMMSPKLREIYVNEYLFADGEIANAHPLIKIQHGLTHVLQLIYAIQIVYSFIKIKLFIKKFNRNIENFYSNLENKTLEWPKLILYSFVVTSVLSIIYNFMGRAYFEQSPLLLLIPTSTYSVLLFIIGYMGNLQNHNIETLVTESLPEMPYQEMDINQNKIEKQLLKLFEKDKIYTNSDLKISDIAEKLHTNRTYLSNLINTNCGCSFSTFVNRYRVKEAKKILMNEEHANYTLDHIATLAGFGSQHSFIRAFKLIEGTTPGSYRDSMRSS